jgi:hypothetical protein
VTTPALKKKPMTPRQLEMELCALLAIPQDDVALRRRLEELAREPAFGGFTYLWGPALYRRNRVLFRPFILGHFAYWLAGAPRFWGRTAWLRKTAESVDRWLDEVDAQDDPELYMRLWSWRIAPSRPDTALETELRALLTGSLADAELLRRLEKLARDPGLARFTHLWGPILYRRNRVQFHPFILGHFGTDLGGIPLLWGRRRRTKEVIAELERWLTEADRDGDADLFRRIYAWQLASWAPHRWPPSAPAWRAEVLRRFRGAASRADREHERAKLDLDLALDEATATALYEIDADAARPFILNHFPWHWFFGHRRAWRSLTALARTRSDDEFALTLFRRYAPRSEWEKEVLRLAGDVRDPAELLDALEKRHPEGRFLNLARGLHRLVERRGPDVLPYLLRHLQDVWRGVLSRGPYGKLLDLARRRGWADVWAALFLAAAGHREYDREVRRLATDRRLAEDEALHSLRLLAGVSREYNYGPLGLAQVRQLSDRTAAALYRRFPELLRGPFRMHVSLGWGKAYPELTAAVLVAADEAMIDYLAGRAVTRMFYPQLKDKKLLAVIEKLSAHYEALLTEPAEFSARAANVLGQVPEYTIGAHYNQLVRTNRLARLLFERSATAYLADKCALRDLLEAPEIHVQALALRALGLDEPRARAAAADNLDLLLGTLLRPMHRITRRLALRALLNAADTADRARRVHDRARQALDLPDRHYPKEQLVGLIGQLLHRWPELRGSREVPIVH